MSKRRSNPRPPIPKFNLLDVVYCNICKRNYNVRLIEWDTDFREWFYWLNDRSKLGHGSEELKLVKRAKA